MRYYSIEHHEYRTAPVPALEIRYYGMSEAELFAAMDLTRPGLEAVREAVAAEDYGPAIWAWGDYFDTAKPEVWLFDPAHYKRFMEEHFPALAQATLIEAEALAQRTTTFFPWVPQAHTPTGEYDWFHTGQDQGRWINAEYLWSLHQLGRAFLLTGDKAYAQHFQDLFNSWYESLGQLPVHYAVHAEMLIGGQRNMRLLDGLFALRGTGLLRPRTHANALKTLLGTCRLQFQLNQFHTGHSGWKNAQFTAACTLVAVAALFPEFREAPAWRERGQQRLREHLFLDTYEDGGPLDPSTHYLETRLRDAFFAWYALYLNGQDPDFLAEIRPRLEKLCEFSFYTMTPTGHSLALMDGDHTEAHLAFLPLAANLFRRSDFAWLRDQFLSPDFCPTQGPCPALSTQLGADRTYVPADVPSTGPRWTSHFFADTGVAILRDHWGREARYASVYCGRSVASHAHHGFGFLELWGGGRPLLGSRGYGYHTTSDHAVAYLPGYEAPYTADVRTRLWRGGASADVISLEHDGYRQSHETICFRAVAFVKGSQRIDTPETNPQRWWPNAVPPLSPSNFPYFVVFDDLAGPLENIPVRWGGITLLKMEEDQGAETLGSLIGRDQTQPDIGLLLQPFVLLWPPEGPAPPPARWLLEATTKVPPYDYWRFQAELPDLLKRNTSLPQAYEQPATRLSLEALGTATGWSFFVLLAPFRVEPPCFEIHLVAAETAGREQPAGRPSERRAVVFAVQHAAGRDLFLFAKAAEMRSVGPWACDADTVIITERDGLIGVVAGALTRLEHDGKPILRGQRLESLDLVLRPDYLDLDVEVGRFADLTLFGTFSRLFVDGVEQPDYLREGATSLHFFKPGPHTVWARRS